MNRPPPAIFKRRLTLAWGIENGSHQRLNVTLNDDRCRVRSPNGLLILGMLRRVVISLFIHWRHRQKRPRHKSLTDFQIAMGEDNLAKAFAFVTNQRPKLIRALHAYALGSSGAAGFCIAFGRCFCCYLGAMRPLFL